MTSKAPAHLHRLLQVSLIATLLALWSCSTAPPKEPAPVKPVEVQPEPPRHTTLDLPPSEYEDIFSAAAFSLDRFDWMAAETALAGLPATLLTMTDVGRLSYLQARIAFVRGDRDAALARLLGLEYPSTHPALLYRAMDLHRHIESLAGNDVTSAGLGEALLAMAPDSDKELLRRAIWRDLQRAGNDELQAARSSGADPQALGWLELAQIARNDYAGPQDIRMWRDSNPQHPAAQPLPGGMDFLFQGHQAPQKVALILPLSGRLSAAGKAVRDGYLAGHYASRGLSANAPEVQVLDQDLYTDVSAAYDQAVLQGAQFIVGPLSKHAVAELARRGDRTVPVVALNRGDAPDPNSPAPLVQLSLSPEDEATRLAEFAFGQDARRAMILRPDSNWGDKMEQALLERWRSLGGTVAGSVSYGDRADFSTSVKDGLGISHSEARSQNVRDILATNIEFTARRRQDVDAVFLLAANGAEARSLKPLLAFHYAGGIPVYSTSAIYSGLPDERDRDLSGINMVEVPWLLGSSPGLRVAIAAGDTGSGNYTRLNALGADAFLLQQRFAVLQAGPDALLRGNTGLLSLDADLRVIRDPSLATFDGGELKPR